MPIVTKYYVQITLNCNQKCPHCCYHAGPERREFMTMDVFRAALKHEPQALFNIGGGEPTCHPLFWEMLDLAVKERGEGKVWLATNGKRKKHALRLAEMVRSFKIRARLSMDGFHEPVAPEVAEAFTKLRDDGFKRVIGNTHAPTKAGRCDWGVPRCNAILPFVQSDGQVRQCGCLDAPIIGDVFSGYKPVRDSERWECWKGFTTE